MNGILNSNPIPNMNPITGIHFGVIHQSKVSQDFISDIMRNGTNLTYQNYLIDIKEELKSAIKNLNTNKRFIDALINDVDSFVDDNTCELEFEADNDVYRYESDGYVIEFHTSDGILVVLKSPVCIITAPCSPCYPNAGDLSADAVENSQGKPFKTYALNFQDMEIDTDKQYEFRYIACE